MDFWGDREGEEKNNSGKKNKQKASNPNDNNGIFV